MISRSLSTQQNCVLEAFGLHEVRTGCEVFSLFFISWSLSSIAKGLQSFSSTTCSVADALLLLQNVLQRATHMLTYDVRWRVGIILFEFTG